MRLLSDQQARIDKIWDWSQAIGREAVLEVSYQSPYDVAKIFTVLPVSLYFDSHYFYTVVYHLGRETYTTLRLDHIQSWQASMAKKPLLSYGRKFRDGDVRNKRVDAFLDKDLWVTVRFAYDSSIILDQFPTAEIIENQPGGHVIRFVSQDMPGLKCWLLSQADALTVLSPQSLVDELKILLDKMRENYK